MPRMAARGGKRRQRARQGARNAGIAREICGKRAKSALVAPPVNSVYNDTMKKAGDCLQSYSRFADVYDLLMEDVDYDGWAAYLDLLLREYAPFMRTRAPTEACALADCACGTGAISIRLSRMGYAVIGVDRSEDMLRVAQQNARGAGAAIPFVCQDMRRLALHRPVDAVCCACDGVNYLAGRGDAEAFFRAAYAALKPGGALLFDISSAYKLAHVLGDNAYTRTEDPCAYIWRNGFFPEERLSQMELTCFVREESGLYRRFDELHVQRAFSQEELTDLLRACGFGEVRVFAAPAFAGPVLTNPTPVGATPMGMEPPVPANAAENAIAGIGMPIMPDTERLQFVALRT